MPILKLEYWEFDRDLRSVSHTRTSISQNLKRIGIGRSALRHGQIVAFFNSSKEWGGSASHTPRCRLYLCWQDRIFLVIPEIDQVNQSSYMLKFSEWLQSSAKGVDTELRQELGMFAEKFHQKQKED